MNCLSKTFKLRAYGLTELFEIELFFDIKTVFTLNRIATYDTRKKKH